MPPIEVDDLYQTAVLWPATGQDKRGESIFGTPVEIDVRWIRKRRTGFDAKGNTILTDITVIVAEEPPYGSLLRLGTLEDWYGASGSGSADGKGSDNGLCEVKTIDVTPDIRASDEETRVQLGLGRYRGKLN